MATNDTTDGTGLTSDTPVSVNGGSALDDLVDEREIVLADFYADWCGPCRMLEPTLEQLAADTAVTVAKYENGEDGVDVAVENIDVGGVFYAVGHVPNTEFLRNTPVELDENGHVVTRKGTDTTVEGVFAAGDVMDPRYRQAITAAGTGSKAALDAEAWLEARQVKAASALQ